MSTSINAGISTQQNVYNSAQQTQQNYKNLFTGLQTGNLQLAQAAFKSLNFSSAALQSNAMLSGIATALSNNDIVSAQNALTGQSPTGGLLNAIENEDSDNTSSSASDPLLQILQSATPSYSSTSASTNASASAISEPTAANMQGLGTLFDQMA